MSQLVSVNVGTPREAAWAGIGRTSIDKAPVTGPVEVGRLGLAGDKVSDTRHHGGVDQAVYAYAREDLDRWAVDLGQEVRDGQFAENLTTRGVEVTEAEVGERWAVGTALLEVAYVRTPCNDFKTWMGRCGFDNRAWVKRFTLDGAPGAYLRVLAPGTVQTGDAVEVLHRPGHGVTIATMFRALHTEPALLPRLLEVEGLAEKARRKAEQYVAARS
ncbi:MOSC domain-containing protein [Nocardioides sp. zg-579]|uniref:MOSC domain-containing protein n=1 Tax=Nocardioides marmotae TaxID=2663857 RepID=A0A6I3JH40_9ACTN|nr:MOSC domain-containing protein [Nocardioides marmotae]MCR6033580.1 MOSC domain-containing protein [Gordonia jinghuaiqii]MTB97238.1 MOSC domain-containing protein [Nocardioides marmotae]QKE02152.1 MOSC domain-containing protein [Nocardioides marmotae]